MPTSIIRTVFATVVATLTIGWPTGAIGADPRLDRIIDLRKDRFAFVPPSSPEAWRERADRIRLQVQVAAGLWPPPERPKPKATIHRRVQRDGYTVEAVSLESFPGCRVTGSLYRPKTLSGGPRPGVLSPHGHWGGGRFHRWDDDDFDKQVALGAELRERGGRFPLQARCVQLARMGCVVFLYDMLGYGDSRQFSLVPIHAPSADTVLAAPDAWGFYSPQAELRLQGPLGVQAYNSQCALDWLASLDDVDPNRIAVTGGSSGATQTLMLCAIDDRPAVAFPVVMVSTAMQGGCGCENACCLRIRSSNVEFAALMAPKPLGMASADDWTRGFAEDGWPELQNLYATLGVPKQVSHASLIQFPHNYNRASRTAMYAWLNEHLSLQANDRLEEQSFEPLSRQEIAIYPEVKADRKAEIELMRTMADRSDSQMANLMPHNAASLERYREVVGRAVEVLLGGASAGRESSDLRVLEELSNDGVTELRLLIRNGEAEIDLPAIALIPPGPSCVAVVTTKGGKAAIIDAEGNPSPLAQKLLSRGCAVVGVDLFAQGELAPSEGPLDRVPVLPGQRPVPSLTYGYNRSPIAHRAGDLLATLAAARALIPAVRRVGLVALDGGAPYAVAAIATADGALDASLIDMEGFRFDDLTSWRDVRFLPGAVKYGDVPGLLALAAPHPLFVFGETNESLAPTRRVYDVGDASGQLVIFGPRKFDDSAIESFVAKLLD